MVSVLKDDQGKVIAFCEWRLVGPSGYEVPNGEYIWISEIWVHENERHIGCVNQIIDDIMATTPQAEYCYFKRAKYGERMKIFPRKQWERRRRSFELSGR